MYLKLVSNIIFEIVLSTSTKDTARFFSIMKRCHCLEGKGDKKMHRDFFLQFEAIALAFLTAESLLKCFVYMFFFLLFTYWIHVSFNETDSNK